MPVETGVEGEPADALVLRAAAADPAPLGDICPYRLRAPLAPAVAARLEGVTIDVARLVALVARRRQDADVLLVEGAGGLLVPLDARTTYAELAVRAGLPLLIVGANRLGTVNHCALTARVAAAHAAAEGEERVRIRAGADEPLRVEARRIRPQVGAAVGQVDAGRRDYAGGQVAPADAHRRLEPAAHLGDHGAQARRLLDNRVEVFEAGEVLGLDAPAVRRRAPLGAQLPQPVGAAAPAMGSPGERGGRRLVARQQPRGPLGAQ